MSWMPRTTILMSLSEADSSSPAESPFMVYDIVVR
jgi:hypothetical protein